MWSPAETSSGSLTASDTGFFDCTSASPRPRELALGDRAARRARQLVDIVASTADPVRAQVHVAADPERALALRAALDQQHLAARFAIELRRLVAYLDPLD